MTQVSLPMLLEDGSSLDWPDASYEPKVRVGASERATIVHKLSGAPSLERALEEGRATWAAEIRCAKTLISRVETSIDARQVVRWERGEFDGVSWIVPGLLAVQELPLATSELDAIWDGERLVVPSGWWLARGTKRKVNTLAQSLLRFVRDEDLDKGKMLIQPETGTGQLRFVAHLAEDLYAGVRTSRTLQVAALIGVCGHFPRVFGADPEEQPAIAREIRARLEDSGVPIWTEDGYDPAQAATAIERFHPALEPENRED